MESSWQERRIYSMLEEGKFRKDTFEKIAEASTACWRSYRRGPFWLRGAEQPTASAVLSLRLRCYPCVGLRKEPERCLNTSTVKIVLNRRTELQRPTCFSISRGPQCNNQLSAEAIPIEHTSMPYNLVRKRCGLRVGAMCRAWTPYAAAY